MSTKPVSSKSAAKKTTKTTAKKTPAVTLKGLIVRAEKIADEASALLGELRSLRTGQKTITIALSSGGGVKQSANPPTGP